MSDHYRTIDERVEARLKIERSEFLGVVLPIGSEEDFFRNLESLQKMYFDATHHCWAFRLFENDRARSSDAGEPSGTAGRPILNAIESAGLFDLGVVVVRWYGGVKLGTGGLARAYRESAATALAAAVPSDRYRYECYSINVPYDAISRIYRWISPPDILLVSTSFGDENRFRLDVRASRAEAFAEELHRHRFSFEIVGTRIGAPTPQ
jgi:uncharacterized YigZ family protein